MDKYITFYVPAILTNSSNMFLHILKGYNSGKRLANDVKSHIFQNVTSSVTLLRDFIAIKACCFFYKGKNKNQ